MDDYSLNLGVLNGIELFCFVVLLFCFVLFCFALLFCFIVLLCCFVLLFCFIVLCLLCCFVLLFCEFGCRGKVQKNSKCCVKKLCA